MAVAARRNDRDELFLPGAADARLVRPSIQPDPLGNVHELTHGTTRFELDSTPAPIAELPSESVHRLETVNTSGHPGFELPATTYSDHSDPGAIRTQSEAVDVGSTFHARGSTQRIPRKAVASSSTQSQDWSKNLPTATYTASTPVPNRLAQLYRSLSDVSEFTSRPPNHADPSLVEGEAVPQYDEPAIQPPPYDQSVPSHQPQASSLAGASHLESQPQSAAQDTKAVEATSDLHVAALHRRPSATSSVIESDCPALIRAVKENQEDAVSALLERGVDIDDVEPRTHRSAVMEAARRGRRHICLSLIRAGARLRYKDVDDCLVLHLAALHGDPLVCTYLLDKGAQLDCHDKFGRLPLQVAVEHGHNEAVLVLLEATPAAKKKEDSDLLDAFFAAIKQGDSAVIRAFLDKGIRPSKLKEAWKPVVYAAESGNVEVLDMMLKAKCSIRSRSPDGWTALHFAAKHGRSSMVTHLLSLKVPWDARTKHSKETALHLAAASDHSEAALILVQHKDADHRASDCDDQEVIHHAARSGDIQLLRALLLRGSKAKTQNKFGWKPIHIATAYGHIDVVAELISRGESVDDKLGSPAFKAAKKMADAAQRGFWAEICWPHAGARPLHLAIEFGEPEIAETLMSAGAGIEEADGKGWRSLHYAAFHCQRKTVETLLSRGASVHATTEDGNTPLSLGFRHAGLTASEEERTDVVAMLTAATGTQKQSILQKLSARRIGSVGTRVVRERNQAWQAAALASKEVTVAGVAEGELGSDHDLESDENETKSGYGRE